MSVLGARQRVIGALLLRPPVWLALLVLIVNDHALKRAFPGLVTGKLSDFAGLFAFPFFLHALLEFTGARAARRELAVCCAAAALAFALIKTWVPAHTAYCHAMGAARFALRALITSHPVFRPVGAVCDPTDLVALPSALLAFLLGSRWLAISAGTARA